MSPYYARCETNELCVMNVGPMVYSRNGMDLVVSTSVETGSEEGERWNVKNETLI